MTVTTIDPATGEPLATYDETPLEEVEAILQSAGIHEFVNMHTVFVEETLGPDVGRAAAE